MLSACHKWAGNLKLKEMFFSQFPLKMGDMEQKAWTSDFENLQYTDKVISFDFLSTTVVYMYFTVQYAKQYSTFNLANLFRGNNCKTLIFHPTFYNVSVLSCTSSFMQSRAFPTQRQEIQGRHFVHNRSIRPAFQ